MLTNGINNLYGVPYVIGARTNLPNFNQFSMSPVVQLTRAFQLYWTNGILHTNVAYQIGVSNVVGAQCWNSYMNSLNSGYSSGISIFVTNDFSMLVTNSYNGLQVSVNITTNGNQPAFLLQINPWVNGVNVKNGTITLASFAIPADDKMQ